MLSIAEQEFCSSEYDLFFNAWNNEDVQEATNPTEQAYILITKYHVPVIQVIKLHLTSYHSLNRAKDAVAMGYDIGISGRHNKLCRRDRVQLKEMVITALKEGKHIYPSTLVTMVSILSLLFTYLFPTNRLTPLSLNMCKDLLPNVLFR